MDDGVFYAFWVAVEGGEDFLGDDPFGVFVPAVEGEDVLEKAEELTLTRSHLVLFEQGEFALVRTAVAAGLARYAAYHAGVNPKREEHG